ncbi:hypothetical protein BCR33DRAFT_821660 [Rhizoclosmatium globosum]|uniref:Uncharacterized protein n=1 Tax=Rhizoclosmatium globosum TaxID=329046 RepID=A0A1Y2C753_9FUNG|nr:hypothetical protein BCR33DRAFT_821660 [Rhizoclosmatium globosum]|eukprot:ORY42853.1 hypothetical protein BCR33DRAFT_821660 [Rhizoclosmatium globosum]
MALQNCVRVNVCLKSHTFAQVCLDLHDIPLFRSNTGQAFTIIRKSVNGNNVHMTILPVAPATVTTLLQSLEAIPRAELRDEYKFRVVKVTFELYTNPNIGRTSDVESDLERETEPRILEQTPGKLRPLPSSPTTIDMEVVVGAVLVLSDRPDLLLLTQVLGFGYAGKCDEVAMNQLVDFALLAFDLSPSLSHNFLEWYGKGILFDELKSNQILTYFSACYMVHCRDGVKLAAKLLAAAYYCFKSSHNSNPLVANYEALARLSLDEVAACINTPAFQGWYELQWAFCIGFLKANQGIKDPSLEGGLARFNMLCMHETQFHKILEVFVPEMICCISKREYVKFVQPYTDIAYPSMISVIRQPQKSGWIFGPSWNI